MHQLGLRALKGLLSCIMSLVLTFLRATNQTKALTLVGTFEFHTNFARRKISESEGVDNERKKDLTEKTPEEERV